jgi:hypothetical protein
MTRVSTKHKKSCPHCLRQIINGRRHRCLINVDDILVLTNESVNSDNSSKNSNNTPGVDIAAIDDTQPIISLEHDINIEQHFNFINWITKQRVGTHIQNSSLVGDSMHINVQLDDNGSDNLQKNSDDDSNSIFGTNLVIPTNSPIYKKNINNGYFSIYRIYEILSNAQVPFYVHDKIIETIGYEIVANEIDPFAPEFKRKTFIKQLCNNFTTPKPQVYTVHLEIYENTDNHDTPRSHRDCVEAVCFYFIEQLKDLLSDLELFGNMDNLVVNNNPNKPEAKWLPDVNKK